MSNVIPFPTAQPATITGEAICGACRFTWSAVAGVGTKRLECPSCGCMQGHFVHPCIRDEQHWTCSCGNDEFRITPTLIYCPTCGKDHQPPRY
jgi:hypothetical protein